MRSGWQEGRDMLDDPFTLADGYVLDVIPSDREASALRQLRSGDRIVVSRSGGGYRWEQAPSTLREYLVLALIHKGWVSRPCPDGPLFGRYTDGTLTYVAAMHCGVTKLSDKGGF